MVKTIYFFLSFLVCFITILLVKKADRKISIINNLIICYILQLCFSTVAVIPLAIFSIPINIISVSVIYNIFSIILIIVLVKKKEVQLYYINFYDTVAFLVLFILLTSVFLLVFTPEIELKYFNTDTANIFTFVMDSLRKGELYSMYFSTLNCALFIEGMFPFFPGIYSYKSFIIISTFMTFINGMMFYVLIAKPNYSKKIKIAAILVTVLYTVGWPLYSYVPGGWIYWGDGVTLCMFGIYLLGLYKENGLYRKKILVLLFINMYCIAVTYMLFTPYIVCMYIIALTYCFVLEVKEKEKIKGYLKKVFGIALVVGVILIAVVYNYFNGNVKFFLGSLAKDGGIHKELYRDFIYFLPVVCYALEKVFKNKKIELNFLLYLSFLVMVLGSYFLCLTNILSPYYYYRLYFILWMLTWLITFDVLRETLVSNCIFIYTYGSVMLVLCIFTFTPLEEIVSNKGLQENKTVEFPIYSAVGSYVKSPAETIYDDEEFWEILIYLQEHAITAPLVVNKENSEYYYWYSPLTGVGNYSNKEFDTMENEKMPSALVVEKTSEISNEKKKYIEKNYRLLFENEYAAVYSK